jgi:hypothetical protein
MDSAQMQILNSESEDRVKTALHLENSAIHNFTVSSCLLGMLRADLASMQDLEQEKDWL